MVRERFPAPALRGYLDDAVAQLTEVIHEGHPALGVVLTLGAHETLTHDAGTLDGAGEFAMTASRPRLV